LSDHLRASACACGRSSTSVARSRAGRHGFGAFALPSAYAFKGGADGDGPVAGVVLDKSGNVYGVGEYGGDRNCGQFGSGCGVVFKVDSTGKETVLHAFVGGPDGANPTGTLVRDAAGNLYGTTLNGGGSGCGGGGCGTVFKLDAKGEDTVLHKFSGGRDGGTPFAGLTLDAVGNLYGTTTAGGGRGCGGLGCGTVFKLDAAGKETVLHRFTGGNDGSNPQASVVIDADGNIYGTTLEGGGFGCNDNAGCGTLYQLNPFGKEQILHRFNENDDGGWPYGLSRDAAGNFYGTASIAGPSGSGTVFELAQSGKFTVLHSFTGIADGASPSGGVILDDAENLYGTAAEGGRSCGNLSCGTVFELDKARKFTVLHSFIGEDGAFPIAGLARDRLGNLYGTTIEGGPVNSGVGFKLTP
jgi:uncharacterized repeat protein (TIGR03803 family)